MFMQRCAGRLAMRHVFRLAVLVPALTILPALAAPSDANEEKIRNKLLAGTTITGKLTAVDADGEVKKFTVQVSNQTREVDEAAKKSYDDLYKRYTTAYQKRDTKTVQKLGPELQKAKNAIYVTKDNPIEFQFVGD